MFRKFKSKYVSLIFVTVLVILWESVLLSKGVVGLYAWWGLMFFGLIGMVTSVANIVIVLLRICKKRLVGKGIIFLIMISLFAAWPGLWLFGIERIAYPADVNTVKPSVSIRSPFEEPVIVAWGGDTLKDNYHAFLPFERWAYDLFATPALVESQTLEDYGIYAAPIVAPISGTVVGVYNGEKDHGTGLDDFDSMLGNYIFIRIKETGTYLVLAHLKYKSVLVKVGDYVEEGTPLAEAGNTGSSSEPHLHIQHQKQDPNKSILLAEGLPLYFWDIEGSNMPKGGGDRVENGIRIPNGETISPLKNRHKDILIEK